MRLLVADKLDLRALSELEVLGVTIESRPELTAETLAGALEGVGILVVRSTRVTAEAIEAAPSLSLIVRAGAGVNNVDVPAASRRGIYVANCPGKNAASVAELTLGLVLALDRQLIEATASLRQGRWEKARFSEARGVWGRRFGVAGLGAIGTLVVKRARSFGAQLAVWSRSLTAEKAARLRVARAPGLVELARRSDILTVHLPLTSQTRGIVDREVLAALPDGAIVVNTARSEVLDYEALRELAPKKGLRIGLDVFPDEPKGGTGELREPLFQSQGVVAGTPHIGASTQQAQEAIAAEVCRIVRAFLTEEDVPHVVNICRTTPARWVIVLRSRDEVGVLANVLNVIKRHGLNIEEIGNTVFEGARAACTKLRVSGRPPEACLREIRAFDEVFYVDVIALPNLA